MSPDIWLLLGTYAAVAGVVLGSSIAAYSATKSGSRDQRFYARMILLAPLWPATLVALVLWFLLWFVPKTLFLALRGLPNLWRAAFAKENDNDN